MSEVSRLLPFEFAKTDTYVIEAGNLYMRFYRNSGQILDPVDPYEIVTVFEESELFELQYVQDADEMYIVHPNHPPQLLTRSAHATWTIADYAYEHGPFIDENETTTTLTPSALTGSITVDSSATSTFTATDVGALWQISHKRDANSVSGTLTANGSSDTVPVGGNFTIKTKGTWTGTITVEKSDDDGSSWDSTEFYLHSEDDGNIDDSGSEDEVGILYRVTMSAFSSGSATYNFSAAEYTHRGDVEITAYTDANTVTATVVTALALTDATTEWAEGAWSDARGWPESVEFHEQRLTFGGTGADPQTIWASTTDDYVDMLAGVNDDDAYIFVLPGKNPIQWLISHNFLMVGTLGGVGRFGHENEATTPDNPAYRMQSKHGSAYIQAVMVGSSIVYVERGTLKVRELAYSLEADSFKTPDLTVLAEDITGDGLTQIAYQSHPDSILWCVTSDGNLASLTYHRDQDVVAWAIHSTSQTTTDGNFESVAVIPGSEEDEIWVIVQRTIDGSTVRYVEQFQPQDFGDQDNGWFVDCGLDYDGGPTVDIDAITKADPIVVTCDTYPVDGDGTSLTDGTQITITGVIGMTELNGNVYSISNPNVGNKTMELRDSGDSTDIDSSAYTAYTSGGTVQGVEKDFTGAGHLEGEEVVALVDGAPHAGVDVDSSAVSISLYANRVILGRPYTSILETLPIVLNYQGGTTAGATQRTLSVAIDYYQSLGGDYGSSADDFTQAEFPLDSTGTVTPLFTGYQRSAFVHGFWDKPTIYIQEDEPVPVTIRAIIPEVRVSD